VRKIKNLVQEYLDIIEEYKELSYILDKMVNYEVKIETVFERNIRALAN
jgi:hypothetical protein